MHSMRNTGLRTLRSPRETHARTRGVLVVRRAAHALRLVPSPRI